MSRFNVTDLPLPGLKLIERQRLSDSRGSLSRLFCAEELAEAGWHKPVAQINKTQTTSVGTVRGLHYQRTPHTEMKLVSCLRGEVWDVAVDLRRGSSTFLHWRAERLSADNGRALLIPEGFAHGFQSLTDHVELLYCHSVAHASTAEGGIRPTDPLLSITWPLAISELSARDGDHPLLNLEFTGLAS